MFKNLPKGWVQTTLGEITAPSRERAMPSDEPDLPYVGLEHVESQTMKLLGYGETASLKSSSVRFHKGDVLYGKMRPYLNKVWPAEFDGLCSAEFLVFPCVEGLNKRLFACRLNSQDFVSFANQQVSGDRPRVDFEKLASFPYLLAPHQEQERIVEKLDAILARLATSEVAARRALKRLQRYRVAVLHAAVTGELTCDWRRTNKHVETGAQLLSRVLTERRARWEEAELKRLHNAGKPPKDDKWKECYPKPADLDATELPSLPQGWTWAALQQLGYVVGGVTKNPRRASLRMKVPYLRVGNVYANELRLDEVKTIGVEKAELEKLLLEKGDLLIVEGNGSKDQIGRLAIWDGSIEKCVHQNHIIKVRLVEKGLGAWILTWLLSPRGRHHVEKVASSTTGLYTLSVGKIGNLPIPIPPSSEQAEIGYQVDLHLAAAFSLTTALKSQIERAQVARQSLFHEAFAGNLVPQDPKDEPASILLERIRAAHEAGAEKPKTKRMQKNKAKVTRRPLIEVLREQKKPISPEQLFREAGFQPAEADSFYRELNSLRKSIREKKPTGVEARAWPNRARVLLELKQN